MDEPGRLFKKHVRAEALVTGLLSVVKIPIVEVIVTPDITDSGDGATAMNDRFGESPIDGAMGKEVTQMPFPKDTGAIAVGRKDIGDGGRLRRDQVARRWVGLERHVSAMPSRHE